MKKLIFLGAVLLSFHSHSQLGVVTIKRNDYIPIDQWYQVKGQKHKDRICYYNELEICVEKLKLELEPYGLKFTDGELQDDGALLWSINHSNGFSSAVFFDQDEGYGLIDVYSYPTEDEE